MRTPHIRYARRAAGLCPRCGAGKLPEWGGYVHCPDCREMLAEKHRVRASTVKGRAQLAARMRRYRAKNSDDMKADDRDRYWQRKEAGLCVQCAAPACDDCNMCETHRETQRVQSLASYHRRKNGEKAPPRKHRATKKRQVARPEPSIVEPLVQREAKHFTPERVATAIGHFDSVEMFEIAVALGCPDGESPAYGSLVQIVTRLVKRGVIERYGTRNHYSYRLVAARRAA